MKIAITVDTEKDLGFSASTFGIDEAIPLLTEILREYRVKATFFISGDSAEYLTRKGHLERIAGDDHEIASHGFAHTDYREWPYDRVVQEISRSKKVLEDLTGRIVKGYRAPQFLINERIIAAVRESGFLYDSSLPDDAGFSAARHLRHVKTEAGLLDAIQRSGLREFPIDSIPLLKLPHGLLWVNLVGLNIYKALFRRARSDCMIFYLHPFDLVKNKRRVPLDLKRRLIYLRNENGIIPLMKGLLDFWIARGVRFVRLEDLL